MHRPHSPEQSIFQAGQRHSLRQRLSASALGDTLCAMTFLNPEHDRHLELSLDDVFQAPMKRQLLDDGCSKTTGPDRRRPVRAAIVTPPLPPGEMQP